MSVRFEDLSRLLRINDGRRMSDVVDMFEELAKEDSSGHCVHVMGCTVMSKVLRILAPA